MRDQPLRSCRRFADVRLYGPPRLQWFWWHRCCYLLVCAGFPHLQQCWNLTLRQQRSTHRHGHRWAELLNWESRALGESDAHHSNTAMLSGRSAPLLTFGPFDEFDLCDLLCSRFPAEDIEADDSACLLQSFHSLTMGHLPHINIVYK